jgi:DNA ligase-1
MEILRDKDSCMKRTFLQLSQTYKEQSTMGWFASNKLDGMRCFYDGGVSRGVPTIQVPWANTVKDGRLVNESIATGLWSRIAKPLYAPDWWLDSLPNFPLDGELYLGEGKFQQLTSIVKSHSGTDWSDVKYMVFDSPPLDTVLADGTIEVRMGNVVYHLTFKDCMKWVSERSEGSVRTLTKGQPFEFAYGWLKKNLVLNDVVRLVDQEQLPFTQEACRMRVEEKLNQVVDAGGEGLVLRNHMVPWKAERAHSCLKHKPFFDAEGTVIGYMWGRETDYGSRLLGKMGSLLLDFNGKELKLSGFGDAEREMVPTGHWIRNEAYTNPGSRVSSDWHNPLYPIGSQVTLKYRELTNDGLPKEARVLRRRND